MTSEKRRSHSWLWTLVRIDTKTVTRALTLAGSSSATRRLITPSSSSFWMRRQQGVVESPTLFAISATASVAFSCKRRSILRSRRSIENSRKFFPSVVLMMALYRKNFLTQVEKVRFYVRRAQFQESGVGCQPELRDLNSLDPPVFGHTEGIQVISAPGFPV